MISFLITCESFVAAYMDDHFPQKELEPTEKRLKELQDNQLAVVQFTPHNKTSSNGICGTTQMSNPKVSLNGTGGKVSAPLEILSSFQLD